MFVNAKLDPNCFIAKQWAELFPQGGTIAGAKFVRDGQVFVCRDIPPESLRALEVHPYVTLFVTSLAVPTPAPEPEPEPAVPPADEGGADLADEGDVEAELEALLGGTEQEKAAPRRPGRPRKVR